jgi:aspartate aminotransferase
MAQKARDLKSKGHDVISLTLGEPDFDTPDFIKEAAMQALRDGYTKYTPVPGLLEFREAISRKFKRDNDLDYGVGEIVVSNGAKQTIANVCLALLDPEDEVIVFTPYWVSYYEIIKFATGTPVKLAAGIEQDFKVTADQLRDAITPHTKALIFSSPCNPTGSVYTEKELREIADVLADHPRIVVISDEIYEHINFTAKHFSIGSLPALKDRVVTVNGMSKGFAMTGWRLGYMGAPAYIASACAKIQGQFTSGATSFGQKAAAVALDAPLDESHRMRDAFLQRRSLVVDGLKAIPGVKANVPQGAFYAFPDVAAYFGESDGSTIIDNSEDLAEYLLESAHVGVVAGSAFGADNCIRLSYAASEQDLTEAIARISAALGRLK